jgi:hypothetical protein
VQVVDNQAVFVFDPKITGSVTIDVTGGSRISNIWSGQPHPFLGQPTSQVKNIDFVVNSRGLNASIRSKNVGWDVSFRDSGFLEDAEHMCLVIDTHNNSRCPVMWFYDFSDRPSLMTRVTAPLGFDVSTFTDWNDNSTLATFNLDFGGYGE